MKILSTKNVALILASSLAFVACDNDDDNTTDEGEPTTETLNIPETITITETSLFPEGIDYNNNDNQFYFGSVTRSEIGSVDPDTGAYTTFITDENFVSVAGVLVDEASNRLYAVSGDSGLFIADTGTAGAVAYLGVYNLETGSLIQGVDLAVLNTGVTGVFANDIALDTDGNIYVTDSFAPFIYRVDGSTFEASIFVDGGEDLTPAPGGFGLNGIVYVDGNLIAGRTDNGTLYRIPLEDPSAFEAITTDTVFGGLDGMEIDSNGDIVVVRNGFAGEEAGLYSVSSSDGWITAEVGTVNFLDANSFPTTAALAADGNIYAVNSYFSVLILDEDESNDARETFSIVRR